MDKNLLLKKSKYIFRYILFPKNLNINYIVNNRINQYSYFSFYIENIENKENCRIKMYSFLNFENFDDKIKVFIKNAFINFKKAKMILYTFCSKFINEMNGISLLYRGTINVQGLGYTVKITMINKNMYNLFFRFGFKDKCNYIMPKGIKIENVETAKTKIIMHCKNIELLKKVQIQIQNLRKPKAFKLQGIYLNDIFPKVKKFVK